MPLYQSAVATPTKYENVALFVTCCLVESEDGRIAMSDLYESYRSWCRSVGAFEMHPLSVVGRLLTHYGVRKVNTGGIKRVGIALRDEPLVLDDETLRRCIRRPEDVAYAAQRAAELATITRTKKTRLSGRAARELESQAHVDLCHKGAAAWARNELLSKPGAKVPVKFVYSRYGDWCEMNDVPRWEPCDLGYSLSKAGVAIEGQGMNAKILGMDVEGMADS